MVLRSVARSILPGLARRTAWATYQLITRARPVDEERRLLPRSNAFHESLRDSTCTNCRELHLLLGTFPFLADASERVRRPISGEVLEIGSCGHPGLALVLLLTGAKKVHLNNVSAIANRLPHSYAQTVEILARGFRLGNGPDLAELIAPVQGQNGYVGLRDHTLQLWPSQGGETLPIEEGTLDFVFSVSVLEHVREPEALISNIHRMLKPGGWSFHAIDMRDHRDFSEPLAFLSAGEKDFDESSQNRLRGPDFLEAFQDAGFSMDYTGYCAPHPIAESGTTDVLEIMRRPIDEVFHTSVDALPVWVTEEMKDGLAPQFQRYSLAELSATGLNLACHKKEDIP